jgi:hypothetical protein
MSDKYIELIALEDSDKAKDIIASWIIDRCNDKEGEIVYLLDKAYPKGAEERLHDDWVEVLVDYKEEKRWE